MSKKDTIIIAILVNTALLALLFMLAINTNDEPIEQTSTIAVSTMNQPISLNSNTSHPVGQNKQGIDEVDNFLKELSQDSMNSTIIIDEENSQEPEVKEVTDSIITAPAATPITQGEIRYVEVTVKRGDALEKIARHHGTTVEAIQKANGLTSSKLSIGQILRVPISKKTPATTSSTPTKTSNNQISELKTPINGEPKYYTMKTGDSLWQIAKTFNATTDELLRLNHLDEAKARNLKAGDKIRVR